MTRLALILSAATLVQLTPALAVAGGIAAPSPVIASQPAAAQMPPPPADATPDAVARWRTDYISEGRSALLGATPEAVEYAVGGTVDIRPENRVRAWMRWEAFRPISTGDGDTRSYTELVEVDCGEQRGRVLAMDTFPYNNLQGQSRHHDAQDPQWSYPRPNSALEGEVKALCGVRDLALMQLAAAAAAASSAQPNPPHVATLALAGAQPK